MNTYFEDQNSYDFRLTRTYLPAKAYVYNIK